VVTAFGDLHLKCIAPKEEEKESVGFFKTIMNFFFKQTRAVRYIYVF
jgi:hypothetical protein